MLDPKELAALLPGCDALDLNGPNAYRAEVVIGIGPVRGRYVVEIALSNLDRPNSLTLSGSGTSALGTGKGVGNITLDRTPEGRSEEHTSELQSLMRISYAVFCLK